MKCYGSYSSNYSYCSIDVSQVWVWVFGRLLCGLQNYQISDCLTPDLLSLPPTTYHELGKQKWLICVAIL